VCKYSPLSLLIPFTYCVCANSETITAAGRLKIKVLLSNFLKVWIWQTKNIIIQKSYIHIFWGWYIFGEIKIGYIIQTQKKNLAWF
jgi:hypothetical protein